MKKSRKKLQLMANLKKNMSKGELQQDLWTLAAPFLYIIPSTVLGLSGWGGFITSFALTFLTGAIFDKPAICRAAWAIGATQLCYTTLSGTIEKVFNKPVWRMGQVNFGTNGVAGLHNYILQPNTQNISLPGMRDISARPAPELEMNASLNGWEVPLHAEKARVDAMPTFKAKGITGGPRKPGGWKLVA